MQTVFDYIKEQEVKYQKFIQLEDGWMWNMKQHLCRSFLYWHSQFKEENENRDLRPNKNIIRAIGNVEIRTEGFDVKDVELYVDDADRSYLSFITKKYHEKWAIDNAIDTFIDDIVESYFIYGGTLSRDTDENKPEVIDLRSLAFCNQKNILANPFCIKHEFSPSQLREHDTWGKESATMDIERLIQVCKNEENIIIYELIGTLPGEWLGITKDGEAIAKKKDEQQIQVIAYYKDQNKNEVGVCLFKHKLPKLPFKFLARDKVSGRALGFGGVEEKFEAQVWTNWNEVKITEMLEAASKTFFKSTDPAFKTQNLNNLDNLEVLKLTQGTDIEQLDTYPRNLVVFNDAITRWEEHARQIGAASEGLLGETPNSGTPFKLFEAQNIEAKGMHIYRRGKIAVYMEEIYREWILPHIAQEITNDNKFLAELSSDEMEQISEQIAENLANRTRNEQVLNDQAPEDKEALKQKIKTDFYKKGSRRFISIFKNELKDIPLAIRTNIVGKQKNLALLTDKLVNVLRQFIATPQIRQDPEMIKLLNIILESSGMSPFIFGTSSMPQQPQQGGTEPLQALGQLQTKQMQNA